MWVTTGAAEEGWAASVDASPQPCGAAAIRGLAGAEEGGEEEAGRRWLAAGEEEAGRRWLAAAAGAASAGVGDALAWSPAPMTWQCDGGEAAAVAWSLCAVSPALSTEPLTAMASRSALVWRLRAAGDGGCPGPLAASAGDVDGTSSGGSGATPRLSGDDVLAAGVVGRGAVGRPGDGVDVSVRAGCRGGGGGGRTAGSGGGAAADGWTTASDAASLAGPPGADASAALPPLSWCPVALPSAQFAPPGAEGPSAPEAGALLAWPWERVLVTVRGPASRCRLRLELALLTAGDEGGAAPIPPRRAVVAEAGLWRLDGAAAADSARLRAWLTGCAEDLP